jgi:hypothetical protein
MKSLTSSLDLNLLMVNQDITRKIIVTVKRLCMNQNPHITGCVHPKVRILKKARQ